MILCLSIYSTIICFYFVTSGFLEEVSDFGWIPSFVHRVHVHNTLLVIIMPGSCFWTVFLDVDVNALLGGSCL